MPRALRCRPSLPIAAPSETSNRGARRGSAPVNRRGRRNGSPSPGRDRVDLAHRVAELVAPFRPPGAYGSDARSPESALRRVVTLCDLAGAYRRAKPAARAVRPNSNCSSPATFPSSSRTPPARGNSAGGRLAAPTRRVCLLRLPVRARDLPGHKASGVGENCIDGMDPR